MSVQQSDRFLIGRDGGVFRVAFSDLQSALPQPIWGRVSADGTPMRIQGASVVRTNTGRYTVTLTVQQPNNTFPILISPQQNGGRDDYVLAYRNATPSSFDIEVTEQDNGESAGVYRDAGFSFFIPASPLD
jgi:hypothetical protein